MTSNSISLKNNLAVRWNAIDPAWRWALGVFAVARVFYTLWSLVILFLVPSILQNLELFRVPVVASFDLATSERFVYSRQVGDRVLNFRPSADATIVDVETGSVWSLRDGVAVSGALAGTKLGITQYTAEEVFPYEGVAPAQNSLLAIWQRFDTNWYLKLAQRGYSQDDGSTVYFPLYPLLIRVVGTVLLGNDLLAALLISNIALIGVLYLLYQYTRKPYDASAAKRVLVYLVLFPTAFFFFAAYTESLFLLLALGSLYAARHDRWGWAAIWGVLAALTRLQGVLLFLPLMYLLWQRTTEHNLQGLRTRLPQLAMLLLIPAATAGFLLFTNLSLLASYEGELHARFVLPWENIGTAVSYLVQGIASIVDLFNLFITLLTAIMCFFVWKQMPRELAIYTILMFLAPLFRMTSTQPLVSMSRYVLVLFPMFILWARWGENGWVNRAIVYPSVLLSLYFSAQFWLWGWVA